MESSMNIQQTATSSTMEAIDNYFRSLPPGYQFFPSDDELVQYYLMRKHLKQELPINRIHVVNIYEHHPQDLAETYPRVRELDWFFFSQRERKYINGVRSSRSAKGGYWKATKTKEKVRTKSGEVIGLRMRLDFFEGKQPVGKLTTWKMYEYTLKDEEAVHRKNKRSITEGSSMKFNGCVLCKIYIKKNGKVPDEINARTSNHLDVTSPDQEDQEVLLTNIETSHDQNPAAVYQIQEDQSGADLIPYNYNCYSSLMSNFDYGESLQNQAFVDGIQHQLVSSSSNNNLLNQNYPNNNIYPMMKGNYMQTETSHDPSPSQSFGSGFPSAESCTGLEPANQEMADVDPCSIALPEHVREYESNDMPVVPVVNEGDDVAKSSDEPVVPVRNQGNDVADGENNLDLSIDDYICEDEVFSEGFYGI